MAITTAPFQLKKTELWLVPSGTGFDGADGYRCQLSQAQLTPSSSGGGGGSTLETFCATYDSGSSGNATWELEISGFQAFEAANDLSLLLFTAEGQEYDFLLAPKDGTAISATSPAFSGTVTLTPTQIGGTANEWATYSVALACKSKPSLVTTAPAFL